MTQQVSEQDVHHLEMLHDALHEGRASVARVLIAGVVQTAVLITDPGDPTRVRAAAVYVAAPRAADIEDVFDVVDVVCTDALQVSNN